MAVLPPRKHGDGFELNVTSYVHKQDAHEEYSKLPQFNEIDRDPPIMTSASSAGVNSR